MSFTSNGIISFFPLLLSKLTLLLDADSLVNNKPLSSLNINASDQVELEGGDSMTHLFTYSILTTKFANY